MYAIVNLKSLTELPKKGKWLVEPYPLEPDGFRLPKAGLWYFFIGNGIFPRFYQDLDKMSGRYATIFYDSKREKYRILNGNETFYNGNNQMLEWDTETEAAKWLEDNHPELVLSFEPRPVVLYDTLPLFTIPKPEKMEKKETKKTNGRDR